MDYRYIYDNGKIILYGKDAKTQVELNRITRYLFGEGASLNSVFNCGVTAFIKFQSKPEVNKQRAYLTTKVWRWCKKNKIKVSHENFMRRETYETFEVIVSRLSPTTPIVAMQPSIKTTNE